MASYCVDRLTEQARRVLVYVQEQARRLDCNLIGMEHLLLGLVREGVAAGVLGSLGVSLPEAPRSGATVDWRAGAGIGACG
jgi:ATP-dependent Clp protease ATP-binding subunit ClpA